MEQRGGADRWSAPLILTTVPPHGSRDAFAACGRKRSASKENSDMFGIFRKKDKKNGQQGEEAENKEKEGVHGDESEGGSESAEADASQAEEAKEAKEGVENTGEDSKDGEKEAGAANVAEQASESEAESATEVEAEAEEEEESESESTETARQEAVSEESEASEQESEESTISEEEMEEKILADEQDKKHPDDPEMEPLDEGEAKEESKEKKIGWAQRLRMGLGKSRDKISKSLAEAFGGGKIDDELYEDLEAVLLTSDIGMAATQHLLEEVRQKVTLKGLKNPIELKEALREALYELILPLEKPLEIKGDKKPFVMMMVGVNGAGKTTSIGKLCKLYQQDGLSVILAAGDTFRAAAREQLMEWGDRNKVHVVSQEKGDSAAVCFDAVQAGLARKMDVVLADTAGRLPSQLHLMEEIKKVKRVIEKAMPDAPHEIVLVLDANIGQNAINQVVAFDDALGLTGIILTKLDGTAKGGVIAALAKTRPVPIRYIGVGETIDDLRPFRAREFVDALIE